MLGLWSLSMRVWWETVFNAAEVEEDQGYSFSTFEESSDVVCGGNQRSAVVGMEYRL